MTRVFVYGLLLRPDVRGYLGVHGSDWQHGEQLNGYSLTTNWGGTCRGIVRLIPTVHGAVFGSSAEFTDEELSRMDRFEGVPDMYTRSRVTTSGGERSVYRANPHFFSPEPEEVASV